MTPFEFWSGHKPSVRHFEILCFFVIRLFHISELDDKTKKESFSDTIEFLALKMRKL